MTLEEQKSKLISFLIATEMRLAIFHGRTVALESNIQTLTTYAGTQTGDEQATALLVAAGFQTTLDGVDEAMAFWEGRFSSKLAELHEIQAALGEPLQGVSGDMLAMLSAYMRAAQVRIIHYNNWFILNTPENLAYVNQVFQELLSDPEQAGEIMLQTALGNKTVPGADIQGILWATAPLQVAAMSSIQASMAAHTADDFETWHDAQAHCHNHFTGEYDV